MKLLNKIEGCLETEYTTDYLGIVLGPRGLSGTFYEFEVDSVVFYGWPTNIQNFIVQYGFGNISLVQRGNIEITLEESKFNEFKAMVHAHDEETISYLGLS